MFFLLPLVLASPALPPELAVWVPYLKQQHPEWACVAGDPEQCAWPGLVSLEADSKGAQLLLGVHLDKPMTVPLPGGRGAWPENLRVQQWEAAENSQKTHSFGESVVVLDQDGPAAQLDAGTWILEGAYVWPAMPQGLPLPKDWGLVRLSVEGQTVTQPRIDSQILRLGSGEAPGESRLEIDVSRQIQDGVPAVVMTRLTLRASGSSREVSLGQVLPEHTLPVSLTADLPARLGPEGDLVVQIRPGTWTVSLQGLYEGPLTALTAPTLPEPWPAMEYWAVKTDDTVRAVTFAGPPGVDPGRTPLPEDWRGMPTFIVSGGQTLQFEELRRGQPKPPENALTLARELWLDTDGAAFTVQDTFRGSLNQGWRLDLQAPGELGHATVVHEGEQEEQVITQGADGATGVELRHQNLEMRSESRLTRSGGLRADGWSVGVEKLSWTLHLPPGWRLIGVIGADSAPTSLVERWNLGDVLVVGLFTVAVARFSGLGWALLALVGMVLSREIPGAPTWSWVPLLATLGLGNKKWEQGLRMAALVGLLTVLLPFSWFDVRDAAFPGNNLRVDFGPGSNTSDDLLQLQVSRYGMVSSDAKDAETKQAPRKSRNISLQNDPNAVVQTGPGLPSWYGTVHPLSWSGPVRPDHQLRLILLSPAINLLLSVLRVGTLLGVAWSLGRRACGGGPSDGSGHPVSPPTPETPSESRPETPAAAETATEPPGTQTARISGFSAVGGMGLVMLLVLFLVPNAAAQTPETSPTTPVATAPVAPDLLGELTTQLAVQPCEKNCVEVPNSHLSILQDRLSLDAEVHAGAITSWPLPGPADTWIPAEVWVDGKVSVALARQDDGFVHLRLSPGVHRIHLEGGLPPDPALTLQFAVPPRRLEATVTGWSVDGIRADGSVEGSLQLLRQAGGSASSTELSPWLEVSRFLDLGVPWRVRTEIRRLGNPDRPLSLKIPLLPGESLTDDGFVVRDGAVQVALGRDVTSVQWLSTLDTVENLQLTAPSNVPWSEVWEISCSPIFACATKGPPPLAQVQDGDWSPRFRPWPGETLLLTVSRPEAAPGQTLTIDGATANYTQGPRLLESTLELTVRTSQGGKLPLTLPVDARVVELKLNGQSRPMEAQQGKLELPLQPGRQTISLRWQLDQGPKLFQRLPEVDLGAPAVNLSVKMDEPSGRWLPLFAVFPQGPVVLWWGRLFLLGVLAVVSARFVRFLSLSEWLLVAFGFNQLPWPAFIGVAIWLWALSQLRTPSPWLPRQLWVSKGIVVKTIVLIGLLMLVALFWIALYEVLLESPNLLVHRNSYTWFADRSPHSMPAPWFLSFPLWTWRLLHLIWALYLLVRLPSWARKARALWS